jgi:DNA polymerase III epsilon subunit-like protein
MRVLGLDVETTGLSFETDHVTEIGCVLYDVEQKKPLIIYLSMG